MFQCDLCAEALQAAIQILIAAADVPLVKDEGLPFRCKSREDHGGPAAQIGRVQSGPAQRFYPEDFRRELIRRTGKKFEQ